MPRRPPPISCILPVHVLVVVVLDVAFVQAAPVVPVPQRWQVTFDVHEERVDVKIGGATQLGGDKAIELPLLCTSKTTRDDSYVDARRHGPSPDPPDADVIVVVFVILVVVILTMQVVASGQASSPHVIVRIWPGEFD
jgi:hypothetical protein